MAAAADKNVRNQPQKGAAPAAKGGSKLPLIVSIVAVLAAAGAGGGWYWSSRQTAAAEQAAAEANKPKLPAPAQYLTWSRRSWSTSMAPTAARSTCRSKSS